MTRTHRMSDEQAARSFEAARCLAERLAGKWEANVGVFTNAEGTSIARALSHIPGECVPSITYVALGKLCAKRKRSKKGEA